MTKTVCPNCGQWQHPENGGDCLNECVRRGFAPAPKVAATCTPEVASFIDPTCALQRAGLLQVKEG